MKLKLVVASMSVLGLISCPVFAASHTKHKHHQKVMKQMEATHDYKDYKGEEPVPVCMISASSMTMNEMSQNMGRSMPNPCNPGWFNRVQFSGGVNVDLGKFGNRNQNYMGENYQRFSLNDAYLNVAASVNDWAKAFASISYNTATINDPSSGGFGAPGVSEYSAAYSNNVTNGGTSTMQLEQAYATFGNFDMSPFFLQIGKQFQDFSRYEIHPITRSLTQVMSETLATSLEGGFIANGFNGSLYVFDDPLAKVGQNNTTTNYGLALGYSQPSDQLGWDIGGAYLYNLIGVNDVAYTVNQFNTNVAGNGGGYNTRIGGTAWYADVNSGPFVLGARYTTALQRFNQTDLPKDGSPLIATSNTGAKPWAAGAQAGYGFDAWGKDQNIYLGYQASREAAGLGMPESRWLLGYNIELFGKNTSTGIEWDRDIAYSVGNGGSNNNTNLVSVRTSVKFG